MGLAMGASSRNLTLALTAAALLHVFILSRTLLAPEFPSLQKKTLTVTIFEEKLQQPEPEPEQAKEAPAEEPIKDIVEPTPLLPSAEAEPNPEAVPIADDLVVATKPAKESEAIVMIQISSQSTLFKRWLKSETDSFANQAPESVGKFDQTFEATPVYESPEELSPYRRNSVPRASTTFKTEYKGKRTCYVKDMNLLDISASPLLVTKDCTVEKKFDLQLNQPNNGWADR